RRQRHRQQRQPVQVLARRTPEGHRRVRAPGQGVILRANHPLVMTPRASTVTTTTVEYISEVGRLLWPAPATATLTKARSAVSRAADEVLVVLPDARRPKLIVPGGRRAGAAAIRRYGQPGSVRTAVATRALAAAVAGGLGPVLGDRLAISRPDE